MTSPLTLLLLTIFSFTFVAAQTWEDASYFRLATMPCVKDAWFSNLWFDSPNFAGMKIPDVDISQCRLDCWHSDYKWAFWQSITQRCICSYEENLPADQVAETVRGVFFCQGLGVATLNHLVAQYDDHTCVTTKPNIVGPATHYPTVHQCIDHCGKSPSEADFYRTSYITPAYDSAAGAWNYLCECSHSAAPTTTTTCGPNKIHVYTWNWDYSE
ncbi:hypothetical protein IAT40_005679 [Kwoniella sp. CBS 6097]